MVNTTGHVVLDNTSSVVLWPGTAACSVEGRNPWVCVSDPFLGERLSRGTALKRDSDISRL